MAPSQIGQIHPGADDNASGTAGVLELARLFAPLKGQLQRGILFANFAGEELGLLGSAEWVKNPTLPLDKAVAMLNMDIDRPHQRRQGLHRRPWPPGRPSNHPRSSRIQHHLQVRKLSRRLLLQRPHFLRHQTHSRPFLFSGLHSDYHKPSDTWGKINAAGPPICSIWSPTSPCASTPLRIAPPTSPSKMPIPMQARRAGAVAATGHTSALSRLRTNRKWSALFRLKPGSPAAKAGFQAGDVLIQFGDKPIKNLYDFTDALRRSKVGDTVQVTVSRDGQACHRRCHSGAAEIGRETK